MKTEKNPRAKKYEDKVKFDGSFEELVKLSALSKKVVKKKPVKRRETKKSQ